MFVKDRRLITERILEITNTDSEVVDVDKEYVRWWKNLRKSGGFGLTMVGAKAFEKADIEFFTFTTKDVSVTDQLKLLVDLDKKMPVPYYTTVVKRDTVINIYDSRIAMLIVLNDNSVINFLKTIDKR